MSIQNLRANLGSYNISDYLRQRITGILDSEECASPRPQHDAGLRRGGQVRVTDFDSKISKSVGVHKHSVDTLNRLNSSNYSNTVLSPRIGHMTVNDSIFQRSIDQVSKSQRYEPRIEARLDSSKLCPFVITKPVLTGDIVFSDQTFGSILQESESNQKVHLEFTPVSTIRMNQNSSPTTLILPEIRQSFRVDPTMNETYPLKNFVIKMEESIKSASEMKDTAQFNSASVTKEHKTSQHSIPNFYKTKDHVKVTTTFNDPSVSISSGGNYRLVKPEMADKNIQTCHLPCKSIAVQVEIMPVEMSSRTIQDTPREIEDLRTVRRGGDTPLMRSTQSNIQDDNSKTNPTLYAIKPLNLEGIQPCSNHRKKSSDNLLVTGYPGNTPKDELSERSAKGLEQKNNYKTGNTDQGMMYFEYKKSLQSTPYQTGAIRSVTMLNSPMKKPAITQPNLERGSSTSKSKKPQIRYDPSKVITAKVSSFRTPKSQRDNSQQLSNTRRSKDVNMAEPELTNFAEMNLLDSPEKWSPGRYNKQAGFTSACHSPITNGLLVDGQKKQNQAGLIQLKEVKQQAQDTHSSNKLTNLHNPMTTPNRNPSKHATNSNLSSPNHPRHPQNDLINASPHITINSQNGNRSRMLYDFDLLNNEDINNLDSFRLSASNICTLQVNRTPNKPGRDSIAVDSKFSTDMH